jgi:arylformamidase
VHELLLGLGIVVVEGLDLRNVAAGGYRLICAPLKVVGADGAPARVLLESG